MWWSDEKQYSRPLQSLDEGIVLLTGYLDVISKGVPACISVTSCCEKWILSGDSPLKYTENRSQASLYRFSRSCSLKSGVNILRLNSSVNKCQSHRKCIKKTYTHTELLESENYKQTLPISILNHGWQMLQDAIITSS